MGILTNTKGKQGKACEEKKEKNKTSKQKINKTPT